MKKPVIAIEPLPAFLVEAAVKNALAEDMGRAGDITTAATVPATARAHALLAARENGRIAGLDTCIAAFKALDPSISVEIQIPDGADVEAGQAIAVIKGPARPILSAERVALNFTGRLSGIATATSHLVALVAGTKARVTCTRKTTPGLRAFEKYAVRCGGGFNHRFGLDDGILIKDNHIVASGGITAAITAARRSTGHMVHVEVEVDRLDQLDEALAAGANTILLDNMSPQTLREAVRRAGGRAVLEASGNINAATIAAVAATGVDLISSGAITHSARCLDLGLDFQPLS
jgi:nicotinate-nucleotide pyrophosphorylase (carboxylating)